MADKLHKELSIRVPSTGEIKTLSCRLGFDLTEEEISSYKDLMSEAFCHTYQRLYELPDPKGPVKYPRTPGYRPSPEENPYNAWYWRCDIPGAPAGKLHGKTVAIKDSICVAGVPLMCGSRMLESYVPDNDAIVVSRILDAGGKIVGKAVCEEMCFTGTSYTSATGPVVNPHDQTRMALGSSSGSAALVAGGHVDMAMGGDQGGSIRIPAAACGIVGLKPTYGLVPYTGIISGGFLLDHTGPMARTVFDVSLLLEVVAGSDGGLDPRQPRDVNISKTYTSQLTGDISGLRIAVLQEGFQEADDDISRVVRESVDCLSTVGAIIEEVSIPMHCDGNGICDVLGLEGGYRLLHGFTPGARGFVDTSLEGAISQGFKTHANAMAAPGKLLLTFASFIHQTYNGYFFGKAINLADRLCEEYDNVFESYDVLVLPTILTKPPKLPEENENVFETAFSFCQNTAPFNVTGHPALSINAGFSDGLPVGMMIVGRKFQEATVLNVGYAYEKIRDT